MAAEAQRSIPKSKSKVRFHRVTKVMLFIGWVLVFLSGLWSAGVLLYAPLNWSQWLKYLLAAGIVILTVVAIWKRKERSLTLALAGIILAIQGWFISLQPSHERAWRKDVAVLPKVEQNGDEVRLINCRNFDYHSLQEFAIRYEDRTVNLSKLQSVDLFVSYWNPDGLIAHTFLSFNFENTEPVCISIEARPEEHEKFSATGALFKKFELIYVVGDERDLVRVRTNYRHEQVYRYPLRATPVAARRLFEIYLEEINKVEQQPVFYHLLSNNCTVNILRNAERAGGQKDWNIRYLLNGLLDHYLYNKGVIKSDLPFEELRQKAHINSIAAEADNAPDFSVRIRQNQ